MYKHWEMQRKILIDLVGKRQNASCQVCHGTNYAIFLRNLHSDLLLKKNILPVYVDLNHLSPVNSVALLNLVFLAIKRTLVEKKIASKLELENLSEDAVLRRMAELFSDSYFGSMTFVFFFEDLDLLLPIANEAFSNLENISQRFSNCVFIYGVKANLSHEGFVKKYGTFLHLFQNIIYLPIRDEKNMRKLEEGTSEKHFNIIYSLTGGIDKFHAIALDLRNNLSVTERKNLLKHLVSNWHLKSEIHKLWDSLSRTEIRLITQVILGCDGIEKNLKEDLNHLVRLGLLKKKGKNLRLAVGMFKTVGFERSVKSKVTVEYNRNKVLVNGNRVSLKLSEHEKVVLKYLLNNKNKIIGKSELAKSLHGSKKNSEVMVESTVNRLKNKLSEVWINPDNLVAVEKRGYIFKEYN
ncbi:response regulator transcription factor [candidate division WWE3 bacterium]|nr:response regulator transcription factor [candidate division WWE3 bacterium]